MESKQLATGISNAAEGTSFVIQRKFFRKQLPRRKKIYWGIFNVHSLGILLYNPVMRPCSTEILTDIGKHK